MRRLRDPIAIGCTRNAFMPGGVHRASSVQRTMETAVLRLHCPDQRGLVARVTGFVFEQGGNILSSHQHIEELGNRLFMRVHFDMAEMTASREQLESAFGELAEELDMTYAFSYSDQRKRMAIMVSRYDHCLYDLFLRHQYGDLDADIALVVSNHPDLREVTERFGVPFHHVPVSKETKQEAEQETLRLFDEYNVDFVALARYMQILTSTLLDAYPNRIINIHHGFLPAFKGAKPYHQAYEKGVKIIGATAHYANEELDMGPIISQDTVHVDHSHGAEDMLRMGRDVEKQVLARAVVAHIEDRIMVFNNRTIIFD